MPHTGDTEEFSPDSGGGGVSDEERFDQERDDFLSDLRERTSRRTEERERARDDDDDDRDRDRDRSSGGGGGGGGGADPRDPIQDVSGTQSTSPEEAAEQEQAAEDIGEQVQRDIEDVERGGGVNPGRERVRRSRDDDDDRNRPSPRAGQNPRIEAEGGVSGDVMARAERFLDRNDLTDRYGTGAVVFRRNAEGALLITLRRSAIAREVAEEAGPGFTQEDVVFEEGPDGAVRATITQEAQRRELAERVARRAGPEFSPADIQFQQTERGLMAFVGMGAIGREARESPERFADEPAEIGGPDTRVTIDEAFAAAEERLEQRVGAAEARRAGVTNPDLREAIVESVDLEPGRDFEVLLEGDTVRAQLTDEFVRRDATERLEGRLESRTGLDLTAGEDFEVLFEDGEAQAVLTDRGRARAATADLERLVGDIDEAEITLAGSTAGITETPIRSRVTIDPEIPGEGPVVQNLGGQDLAAPVLIGARTETEGARHPNQVGPDEDAIDIGAEISRVTREVVDSIRVEQETLELESGDVALGSVETPVRTEGDVDLRQVENVLRSGAIGSVSLVGGAAQFPFSAVGFTARSGERLQAGEGYRQLEETTQAGVNQLAVGTTTAIRDPLGTAAQAAVTLPVSFGIMRAAPSSRFLIQPGEEAAGFGGAAITRRVAGPRAAQRLFPNNEPLIFSEEFAIRQLRRAGRGITGAESEIEPIDVDLESEEVTAPGRIGRLRFDIELARLRLQRRVERERERFRGEDRGMAFLVPPTEIETAQPELEVEPEIETEADREIVFEEEIGTERDRRRDRVEPAIALVQEPELGETAQMPELVGEADLEGVAEIEGAELEPGRELEGEADRPIEILGEATAEAETEAQLEALVAEVEVEELEIETELERTPLEAESEVDQLRMDLALERAQLNDPDEFGQLITNPVRTAEELFAGGAAAAGGGVDRELDRALEGSAPADDSFDALLGLFGSGGREAAAVDDVLEGYADDLDRGDRARGRRDDELLSGLAAFDAAFNFDFDFGGLF